MGCDIVFGCFTNAGRCMLDYPATLNRSMTNSKPHACSNSTPQCKKGRVSKLLFHHNHETTKRLGQLWQTCSPRPRPHEHSLKNYQQMEAMAKGCCQILVSFAIQVKIASIVLLAVHEDIIRKNSTLILYFSL